VRSGASLWESVTLREEPAGRVSCVVCGVVRAGPGRSVSGVGPGEGRARGGGPAQRFPGEGWPGWAGEKL
jgi:hypothetical protein